MFCYGDFMKNIVPTKGNLKMVKNSSKLAQLGFELMDKKRNILIKELMLIIKHIKKTYKEMSETCASAYKSLQLASLTLGAAKLKSIADTVPLDKTVKVSYRSVMGVEIPVVSAAPPKGDSLGYGFYNSNSVFDEAFKKFSKVKLLTEKLAELEVSAYKLSNAIEKSQKRANSLSNIMIPKFNSFIKYISDSLEEKDREEFSRLKVVKKQKNRSN